jgi:hypothetical protein
VCNVFINVIGYKIMYARGERDDTFCPHYIFLLLYLPFQSLRQLEPSNVSAVLTISVGPKELQLNLIRSLLKVEFYQNLFINFCYRILLPNFPYQNRLLNFSYRKTFYQNQFNYWIKLNYFRINFSGIGLIACSTIFLFSFLKVLKALYLWRLYEGNNF